MNGEAPVAEVSPAHLWRARLLVLALGALVFLPGLGNHDLWNPDEPRYAEVAREMRLSGEFLVPHLNGELYAEKPPLHFWAIAAFGWLRGGVDEVSARLPSALAAMGTLLLVFSLGRRMFGVRAAWLAVAVLATSARVMWQGRVGQIDMQLVFWVTLAVWCWWRALDEERPGLYLLGFLATGLGGLAKGPAGLLPPLLAFIAFLAWTKRLGELRRMRVGWGLLLWLAVMLAWLVPASMIAGWDYFAHLAFRQNVGRYANPWGHHLPWYYFLTVIPGDFFPWSFFLPSALVVGWRRLRNGVEARLRDGYLLCLCWMVVTVVFFSLSPGKRTVYILTMYPAMALLVGAAFDRLALEWPRHRPWLAVPPALLLVLLGTAAALVPGFAARRPETPYFDSLLPAVLVAMLATLALAALAAVVQALGRRPLGVPVALASAMHALPAAAVRAVQVRPRPVRADGDGDGAGGALRDLSAHRSAADLLQPEVRGDRGYGCGAAGLRRRAGAGVGAGGPREAGCGGGASEPGGGGSHHRAAGWLRPADHAALAPGRRAGTGAGGATGGRRRTLRHQER